MINKKIKAMEKAYYKYLDKKDEVCEILQEKAKFTVFLDWMPGDGFVVGFDFDDILVINLKTYLKITENLKMVEEDDVKGFGI